MPSPSCKKCQGRGEHPHCDGCTEWVTCACSVNDTPPVKPEERLVTEFFEDFFREGRGLPLAAGYSLGYEMEERVYPYVIRQGETVVEREASLGEILDVARRYPYWPE